VPAELPVAGKAPDKGLPPRFEADPFVSPEDIGLTDQIIAVHDDVHELPFRPSTRNFLPLQEFVVTAD
jgi:hypothetical protein